jgi:hypothetical protein
MYDIAERSLQYQVFPNGGQFGPKRIGVNGKVIFLTVHPESAQCDTRELFVLRVKLCCEDAVLLYGGRLGAILPAYNRHKQHSGYRNYPAIPRK